MELFDDDRITAELTPAHAVRTMLEAVAEHGRGGLEAPSRINVDVDPVGADRLVFTTGGTSEVLGYRAYVRPKLSAPQEVVVAHSAVTGSVDAVFVGTLLGPRRTGALGGAALSLAAGSLGAGSVTVAVIGSGIQAYHQLWALTGVDGLHAGEVRIYSPNAEHRDSLAERARSELDLAQASAASDAREAVTGADIVLCATTADEPVLATDWLTPDAIVHSLGTGAELPADLAHDAFLYTDSPAQYDQGAGSLPGLAIASLGEIATGRAKVPATGHRIFLSRGLAGTEPLLLHSLLG
ncbi:hypothetical protein NQ036_09825 [Brevibacterium sp. 91QC2O2]|uniref:hypothetical protein n=1 Tax=Brevibacterium TaxID=1696 RepID=UPI00211CA448|nr:MULTISPECIES: hypothetical protein [unclassified Brevibacterium]MCQ9368533.1 hypothetical protein [Brevibacterium sp. 91QC2O2]MCQ9386930.1 hypothetical protein [Brevibacterium sp. 68QC2CO]